MKRAVLTYCRMAYQSPPELLLRNAVRQTSERTIRLRSTAASGKYKAALCTELEKPLSIHELDPKPIQDGMIRVSIQCSAINFADTLIVSGKHQEKIPTPFCPGAEMAGIVTEVGPGVTDHKVGDRVMGMTGMGVILIGAASQESLCFGMSMWKIPDGISYEQAASTIGSYCTAYMALTRRCNLKQGETVLVTAAAGAIGLAAVDLAANVFNCKVIGACGTEEKCALVRQKGAFAAINYNKESMRDRVQELTDGHAADVIIENVGGQAFQQCLRCIAFEGRIAVIGFAGGEIPKIPANILLVKSCSAVGVYWGSYSIRHPEAFKDSVDNVLNLLAKKKINPHYSGKYPLEQINEAYKFLMDRKSTGKVLLDCR